MVEKPHTHTHTLPQSFNDTCPVKGSVTYTENLEHNVSGMLHWLHQGVAANRIRCRQARRLAESITGSVSETADERKTNHPSLGGRESLPVFS